MDKGIPDFIFHKYCRQQINGSFEAVILSVEILGLPLLMEKMIAENSKVVSINTILNKIYNPLAEIIHRYHGEIVDFQSNQLIFVFPVEQIKIASVISAALEIRNKISEHRVLKTKFGNYYLDEIQSITCGLVDWEYFPELKSFFYVKSEALIYGYKLMGLAKRQEIQLDPIFIELLSTKGDQFQFIEKKDSFISIYYDISSPEWENVFSSDVKSEEDIIKDSTEINLSPSIRPAVSLAIRLFNPALSGNKIVQIVEYARHYQADLNQFRFCREGIKLNLMFEIDPDNFNYQDPIKFLEDLKFLNLDFKAGIALSHVFNYEFNLNNQKLISYYGQSCRLTQNLLEISGASLNRKNQILTDQNYYFKTQTINNFIELNPQVISDFARPVQLYELII